MRKFSIIGLFEFVMIVALVIAVFIYQRTIRLKNAELDRVTKEVLKYREPLGIIQVADPAQTYIRRFSDPFTVNKDVRFRIHVPNTRDVDICYTVGVLPDSGLPANRNIASRNGYPDQPADLILVIEYFKELDKSNRMTATITSEVEIVTQSSSRVIAKSWKGWEGDRSTLISESDLPEGNKTSMLDLEQPFTIIKSYATNEKGEKVGFMFWIEESAQKRAARSGKSLPGQQ